MKFLYLTIKNQIERISVREYQTLRLLCRLSKNLYNEALYSVRQFYFAEKKYLVDGKNLKSYNRLYNKENVRL